MSIILISIFFSLSRARISATRNRGKMLPLNAESGMLGSKPHGGRSSMTSEYVSLGLHGGSTPQLCLLCACR